jgi:putative redox protein
MAQETKRATLKWLGDLRFEGGTPGSKTTTIDAKDAAAPGPMPTLLLAAAACSASDVVVLLEKMQVKLDSLTVDAAGTRREEEPRRYVAIQLTYRMGGEGLDDGKARRAVGLAVGKYCSVIASLAPDIQVNYDVALEVSKA